MKCPIDQSDLLMTERHGVEVDYCPKCRGVWLDRGELDKIIDKATDDAAGSAAEPPRPDVPPPSEPFRDERYRSEPWADPSYREEPRVYQEPYRPRYRDDDYRDRDARSEHGDRTYHQYKMRKKKSILSEIFDF
ncbi:MAG: zf-TFIIB domain-containing protein [Marinobacter sp.]|jgi:Zn-finger nucleic acid-binding protein